MAPYRGRGGPGRQRGSSRGRGTSGLRNDRGTSRGNGKFQKPWQSQAESEIVEENEDVISSSSDEEEDIPHRKQHSYSSLLQSFQAPIQDRPLKKRKFTHDVVEISESNHASGDEDASQEDERTSAPEAQTALTGDQTDSDDDEVSDPFEKHFVLVDDNLLRDSIKAAKEQHYIQKEDPAPKALRVLVCRPKRANSPEDTHPRKLIRGVRDVNLKSRLAEPASRLVSTLEDDEIALAQSVFNYEDVLCGNRSVSNAERVRHLVVLHALNHLFKTRDKILKNNARLTRHAGTADFECRDQGFTRPKVLFLLETRNSCVKYINSITKLCEPEQQENRKRFQDAFVQDEDKYPKDKPADFLELFEGNDDNDFRLGLKFTRKTLKFYSQFYNSDVIFASPLGLRRAINAEDAKKTDYDFLSSIELVVVDQADAMLMQNWEHVEHAFEHLNLVPKQSHDCDYSRVRKWYLDHNAQYLRQTIVLSAYITPELNRLYSSCMQNYAGKAKMTRSYDGAIAQIGQQIRQTFHRYDSRSPISDPDDRFKYFTSTVIPGMARQVSADEPLGTLVFIPSYLDFVRIRNFFNASTETQNISFGSISEYTEMPEVRRARAHFSSGRHSVLLYTGRAHHFRRYQIRGVKKVIMYSLPDNPVFYTELVGGFLGGSLVEGKLDMADAHARVIFSRWDSLALERIVGTKRVAKMLKPGLGDTFDFR